MSFYNGILEPYTHTPGEVGSRGPRGFPGPTGKKGEKGDKGDKGDSGSGYKLTSDGNVDIENKKLVNVNPGTNAKDVINKSQLDTKTDLLQDASSGTVVNNKAVIYSNTGSVHTKSVYFEDIPGPDDDGVSNQMRLLTQHQSYNNIHLNIPDLKNFDGGGGRPSSEMMVTSVEQPVTGKKVFRNIEVPTPTSNNQASNKFYIDNNFLNRFTGGGGGGGQIGGNLDMRGHTIKFLGLDNSESAAARVAELNVKLSLGGGTMTGDINLDNHRVKNSLEPTNSKDLTTKNYVDTEIAKIPQGGGGSLIQYVKRDGTLAMTGNLNLDNHRVENSLEPLNSKDFTTKNYVDTEIAKIPQGDSSSTQFVRRDGTLAMTADLNMNDNKVVNLKHPTDIKDATNKKYVDETITESSITGSSTENKFAFLNSVSNTAAVRNTVIDSYDDFNDSSHSNKKAFNITLQINVGTNNYNSQMAFNLQTLPIGRYSMIFEFYPPQMTNVSISCQVAQLILHKQFK